MLLKKRQTKERKRKKMPKNKTKEQFIEQGKIKHGNFYDYSKVNYTKYNVKVCIVCPVHGEFLQKPSCHLTPAGCPKCAIARRSKTQEQIIKDFILSHENKYDYSKVKYVDDSTKVCIICKEHGEFWQEPSSHKRGHGCPKCYETTRTKSQENFICDARKVYGDVYDYSKVNYIGHRERVCVICAIHGEFFPTAVGHLVREEGCPKCNLENKQKEFINRALFVHCGAYDYSRVEYKGQNKKVCIICPKHGEFWQLAKNHIKGYRCEKCKKLVLEDGTACDSQVEAYMYLIHKKEGIPFLHNKRYGKELGGMRFDFYFPSTNTYEEITAYDFRSKFATNMENKLKDFYLKKIDKKKNFVEKNGGKLNFIETRLTREQQVFVFANLMKYNKIPYNT